jgi:hypothetical protein
MWVAVNEQLEKEYPTWINKRLLKEWEMPNHSPLYQMLHFYQNSFFYHLYNNRHTITTKYVGFGQYDQLLNANEFSQLVTLLENDKGDKLIGTFLYEFDTCCDIFSQEDWKTLFLDSYNSFYHMNHTIEELKQLPMILLHTFIMPTWYFNHMMPFIEHITPKVVKALNWNTRHLAGTLERVYALTLAAGMLEGKFRQFIHFKGITQNDTQRTSDSLRSIQ